MKRQVLLCCLISPLLQLVPRSWVMSVCTEGPRPSSPPHTPHSSSALLTLWVCSTGLRLSICLDHCLSWLTHCNLRVVSKPRLYQLGPFHAVGFLSSVMFTPLGKSTSFAPSCYLLWITPPAPPTPTHKFRIYEAACYKAILYSLSFLLLFYIAKNLKNGKFQCLVQSSRGNALRCVC